MPSVPKSLPPPITGWNTRDALDAMAATDAVLLDNWFPSTGTVNLRNGYEDKGSSGMGSGNVDTLAEFHSGATRQLIACTNGNIYNATATGAATSLDSGFSSDIWQTVNFNGRLIMVNGTDAPQDWDGTTLTATSWSGSGLTITDLNGVNAFKNRLYFLENDSQSFWYGGINSVTGTLTEFPLSRVGQFGGNLIAMGNWTHDGGDGVDDYAVFIMSSGEVIVYQGTDPGDAAAWSLVGIYRIGVPLNVRGVVKNGGDLLVMTTDDYVNLSTVLRNGQLGQASKLSGAVTAAARSFASSFGWQATLYNKGNMIIFNVPKASNQFEQHIYNVLTGAATRFTGINARCWGVYNNELYFGGTDGLIYKADTGSADDGAAIGADGIQAWHDFGSPVNKMTKAISVVIQSEGAISYGVNIGYNFSYPAAPTVTATSSSGTPWGSPWGSPWSAESVINDSWRGASGIGRTLSTRLVVSGMQNISWLATDFQMEYTRNMLL